MRIERFTVDILRKIAISTGTLKVTGKFINQVRELCRINGVLVDLSYKEFETYSYDYPDRIELHMDEQYILFK